jgi:hypothetical protein
MNNNIGVVITDGVGFRNFILSEFPKALLEQQENAVIYSCIPKIAYSEVILNNFTIVELEILPEKTLTAFIRKVKELAHLRKNSKGNFGILDNFKLNFQTKLNVSGIRTRLALLLSKFFHSEKDIINWTRLQLFSIKNQQQTLTFNKLIEKYGTDILFFTHQRPPFIAPMLASARQKKIKTCAFIFSWDNISSKGRMAGNFDSFIVWSNLMKEEILNFYPSVTSDQVYVGGTPQFEPYVMDIYKSSSDDFYNNFKLDINKPIICFSCGDVSTSKNDELYITEIATAIENRELTMDVNFIVRTSPAEDPLRFFPLAEKFSFIIWNYPKWNYSREGHLEPWTQRVPLKEDIKDLRAMLEYSHLNINMCSTMSLDFMHFDKPVINTVFGNGKNGLYDDQRFLNYAHYKKVVDSGAVEIVKNRSELVLAINDALVNPKSKSKQRKELLELQIGRPLEGTSKHIVQILEKIANNN